MATTNSLASSYYNRNAKMLNCGHCITILKDDEFPNVNGDQVTKLIVII